MNLRQVLCALAALIPAVSYAQSAAPHCTLPGELVASDATGDASFIVLPDPVPDHDVLDVSVAELANDSGEQKVYFTLTIDAAAPAPVPLSSYQVKFFLKDGVERFVIYTPYPTPAPLTPVTSVLSPGSELMFAYGSNSVDATTGNGVFSIDGPADAESSVDGGTITFVLSEKQLRQLKPGEVMTGIIGVSQFNGSGQVTSDLDSSDTPGAYELKGNDSCKAKKDAEIKAAAASDKSNTNFGGAVAPGLLVLLFGLAGLRRRLI